MIMMREWLQAETRTNKAVMTSTDDSEWWWLWWWLECLNEPYISTALCCITCNWQCESVIEVLFKKSNKYIPNCNEFSLHVNKYALPCSSLWILPRPMPPMSSQPRDPQLLHSPHYIHDIFMSPTVLYIADVVGGDFPATGNCDHLY